MDRPPVSVLVPWRPGCVSRERAWMWVKAWWATRYPTWELVVGSSPAAQPWRKGAALADAVAQARGSIAVVADADVVCEGIDLAVSAVRAGAGWAVPHEVVYRLNDDATDRLLATGVMPTPTRNPGARHLVTAEFAEVHRGVLGGGMAALPLETLREVPIDQRFAGWGQEDMAWAQALSVLHRDPWRGYAPMFHLWHPPQPRASRGVGSAAGLELWQRYASAGNPGRMRALLAEPGVRGTLSPTG